MTSNSPCAACKFLRRKCTQECTFAPYFPPDQPQKFTNVHKVFGASNVSKILQDMDPVYREDAANSLAYEADARIQDPVYGCIGVISNLNQRLREVQQELLDAKRELWNYIGPTGMYHPLMQQSQHQTLDQYQQQYLQNPSSSMDLFGFAPMGLGLTLGASSTQPSLMIREEQQQQQLQLDLIQSQHLDTVMSREQELMRSYEQQQQVQQELARYNSGFNTTNVIDGTGFVHVTAGLATSVPVVPFDNPFQLQHQLLEEHHHHQLQPQLQWPQHPQQQQRAGSEEGSSTGPS